MGTYFPLDRGDVIAYLTSSSASVAPPALTGLEITAFLETLGNEKRLISGRSDWVVSTSKAAMEAQAWFKSHVGDDASLPVPAESLRTGLQGLRPFMAGFPLYGLAIFGHEDKQALQRFAEFAAVYGRDCFFVAIPDTIDYRQNFRLGSPFPGGSLIVENAHLWPGLLLWTGSAPALAAFVPLDDLLREFHDLMDASQRGDKAVDGALRRLKKRHPRVKKLLHVSDLHFGREDAAAAEYYVSSHLRGRLDDVGRVVITGDLFDSPDSKSATAFRSFLFYLEESTDKPAVVIPGNHDRRSKGMFFSDAEQLLNINYSQVVTDPDLEYVFLCFDSSRDGTFARGRVSDDQRLQMATALAAERNRFPEVERFRKIALVHHHPFSFHETQDGWLSKKWEEVNERLFLRMEDADNFLAWCASAGTSLILHGHKHVPRCVSKTFPAEGENTGAILSIGCGSSLGVGLRPYSYNLVSWNEEAKRWIVSFFTCARDGGGFKEELVSAVNPDGFE